MNTAFILFAILITLVGFSLGALLLQFLTTLYQVKGITFLRAILVLLSYSVVTIICVATGSMLGISGLSGALGLLVGSIIVYYVYKKYSDVSARKFTAIWITYLIIGFIAALIVNVVIRPDIIQPFVVAGDSMAPAYPTGDYLIIEEWDKTPHKGDVVIANISNQNETQYVIARVAGISGDVIAGVQVSSGEYYLSKDNPSAKQIPGLVSGNTIVGEPILDLGHTNF